jgi:MFS family permease
MVLGVRVGKKRGFWRGFFLSLGTVGFYAVYWNYKAHDEVYKQFELQRENRDEGVLWYLLGLIFPPFVFAYLWTFASNVAYVRERMRLPRRSSPGSFVGLLGVGLGLFLAGWFALIVALTVTEAVDPAAESTPVLDAAGSLFLAGFVLLVVLGAVAYYRMQRDLNELWDAYDRRVQELIAAPRPGPFAVLPPLPPHPTSWAEVAAPPSQSPSPPEQA